MATLTETQIIRLLEPFYPPIRRPSASLLVGRLSSFLDLLMKWNAGTNLSAIRDPETIVQRHFGESLFTALHLPPCLTLLDYGSGAGFPGMPIALALPGVRVTLAESQNKKASFLRETVRVLRVDVEVWANRVDAMPPERTFDVVTLRAVDRPAEALRASRERLAEGGYLMHLGSRETATGPEGAWETVLDLPGSEQRVLRIGRPQSVPRGTL